MGGLAVQGQPGQHSRIPLPGSELLSQVFLSLKLFSQGLADSNFSQGRKAWAMPDLQGVQGKLITAEAWQGLTEPRQWHSHNKISFFFFQKKEYIVLCALHTKSTHYCHIYRNQYMHRLCGMFKSRWPKQIFIISLPQPLLFDFFFFFEIRSLPAQASLGLALESV